MKSLPLLLLLVAQCLWAQASITVTGIVRHAVTRNPLPNILITLIRTDRPGPEPAATTVPDGRFEFQVPPGTYRLMAESPIFGGQVYGASNFQSGAGVGLVLASGARPAPLDFLLTPPSAIEGIVADGFGEPVQAALVQLFETRIIDARRRVIPRGSAYTNDLGEYRFPGLGQGEYHLIASGTPWHTADRLAPHGSHYVTQFYPSSRTVDGAAPLLLGTAEEARADFRLDESTGPSVELRLVDAPPGIVLRLSVNARGFGGRDRLQHLGTVSSTLQRIDGLPPGEYEVVVQGVARGKQYRGSARLSLASADVRLPVPVSEMPTVSGRVDCAGPPSRPPSLTLYDAGQSARVAAVLRPDGTFISSPIGPGRYTFLLGSASGCYVDQVTVAGEAVPGNRLLVGGSPIAAVAIAAKSDVASLHGIVRQGESVRSGAKVYLAPVVPHELGTYREYIADSDGSFDFRGIPPGRYTLFLAPGAPALFAFADPDTAAPYLRNGIVVELSPGGRIQQDLEVISGPSPRLP